MPDYAEAARQYEIAEEQADLAEARAGEKAYYDSEARRFVGLAKDCAEHDPPDPDGAALNKAAALNMDDLAMQKGDEAKAAIDASKVANQAAKDALED